VPDLLWAEIEYPAYAENTTFDPFGMSTSGGEENTGEPDLPSRDERYPPPHSSACFNNTIGQDFAANVTFDPFGLNSSTS